MTQSPSSTTTTAAASLSTEFPGPRGPLSGMAHLYPIRLLPGHPIHALAWKGDHPRSTLCGLSTTPADHDANPFKHFPPTSFPKGPIDLCQSCVKHAARL